MRKNDPLLEQVRSFCRENRLLPSHRTVLAALSGGRDSIVMTDLLLQLSHTEGFTLVAAHFNHHLRPTAGRDEDFVRNWCASRNIPLTVGNGEVRQLAGQEKISLEDAARRLRYGFLQRTAEDLSAAVIATAHHRQDNAETVLMHLLRGSGMTGLCGIAPRRGNIIRPLLETDREEIDRYLSVHGLSFVEDESNCDTTYFRNRLRQDLLPLLEELSPGSTRRIAGTAALLRQEEAHWEQVVQTLLPLPSPTLSLSLLSGQDTATRRRLVRHWLRQWDVVPTALLTDSILRLKNGGCLPLSGELQVYRDAQTLIAQHLSPLPAPLPLRLGQQIWDRWQITLQYGAANQNVILFPPDTDPASLSITYWDGTGRLPVENGSRTIKRLMTDCHIPLHRQRRCPLLLQNGIPVGVWGISNQCSSATDRLAVLLQDINKITSNVEEQKP